MGDSFETLLNGTQNTNPGRQKEDLSKEEEGRDYNRYDPTDAIIVEKEVEAHVENNKNNTATFLDKVSNEMLKYATQAIIRTLTQIFNAILSMGIYPRAWKGATLAPLHKKGY